MSPARFLRDLVVVLAGAGCAVWGITHWLLVPCAVLGPSMRPTLRDGDRVLVDLRTFHRRLPRPGDVVVIEGPDGDTLVKRVAHEPYPGADTYPPAVLVADSALEPSFVVLGDNPEESQDSRAFGRVPLHRIRGRVCWRYWPLTRFGSIE